MNRLQHELHRLYLPTAPPAADGLSLPSLTDGRRMVRALVIEIAAPASWQVLGKVWQGVQAELELPAPAIAVSGSDGLQLWFSLVDAIPTSEAHAFLEGLRLRYLPDIPTRRIRLLPSAGEPLVHAAIVPACQGSTGNWSAFVAPDLAPVFADTPWLDIPPGEDGQASLLRGLQSARPSAFAAAVQRLGTIETRLASASPPVMAEPSSSASAPESALHASALLTAAPLATVQPAAAPPDMPDLSPEPEGFLRRVMNDPTVALAHRIDAAKALLAFLHHPLREHDDTR